jgi:hypothetical protein
MAPRVHIETPRLFLREWTDADAGPFAALNADPRVMEFFPKALTRAESDALMADIREDMADEGFGLYAVEVRDSGGFIGFIGLARPTFEAPFMPAIEIGWPARTAWGTHATSRAVLPTRALGLKAPSHSRPNEPAVTARHGRIGMTHDPADDFDHPELPPGTAPPARPLPMTARLLLRLLPRRLLAQRQVDPPHCCRCFAGLAERFCDPVL